VTEATEPKDLTPEQARQELARLAAILGGANLAYHQNDAPDISDAEYDRLKQRNAAIEAAFPDLVRDDSPSLQVGAPAADEFSKITHTVRMMSLANAFDDDELFDFRDRIKRYLGQEDGDPIALTAEPKIDGL